MEQRRCDVCGRNYTPNRSNQRYCGKSCAWKAKRATSRDPKTGVCWCRHCGRFFPGIGARWCKNPACQADRRAYAAVYHARYQAKSRHGAYQHSYRSDVTTNWTQHHHARCWSCGRTRDVNRFDLCRECYGLRTDSGMGNIYVESYAEILDEGGSYGTGQDTVESHA